MLLRGSVAVIPAIRDRTGEGRLSLAFGLLLASAVIGLGISFGPVYLFHVALVAYVWLRVLQLARGRLRAIKGVEYFFPLLLLLAWYTASVLWAENSTYALLYLSYLLCGLSVTLAIVYEVNHARALRIALMIAAVCVSIELLICVLEIWTDFRYPISPYSPHARAFGRTYTLARIESPIALAILGATPTGFRWNPNNLAATLVIVLPFFGLVAHRWLRWLLILTVCGVVVATGSRTGFVALVGVLALMATRVSVVRAAAVVALAVAFASAWPALQKEAVARGGRLGEAATAFDALSQFLTTEEYALNSVGIRQRLARNGLEALRDSKGLGVGAGGSKTVQEKHGTVAGITSMHNFWLEVVVEAGVIAGFAFLLWYVYITWRSFWLARNAPTPYLRSVAHACGVALAGFSVAAVSASSTVYLLPMWILFGIAIAVFNLCRTNRPAVNPYSRAVV